MAAKLYFYFIMRILFFYICFMFLSCSPPQLVPKVEKGILDLREWNFEKQGPVELVGEWEFYWGRFLYPKNFQKSESEISVLPNNKIEANLEHPLYLKTPSVWKGIEVDGKILPGHGFATYRMRIKLESGKNNKLAFRIKDQAHAYRFFMNGNLVVESGIVGDNAKNMKPSLVPVVYGFFSDKSELELIFHVSNFHHRVGGLRFEINIGTENQIRSNLERLFVLDSFLYGGFLIISIYHIAIYLFRRKNQVPMYFAIFCLSILVYSMVVGQRFLYQYFPTIWSWEMAYKVEFISLSCILISIIGFFTSLYPVESKYFKALYRLGMIIPIVFILFTIFTNASVYTEYLIIIEFGDIIGGIFIIFHLLISIIQKKEGSLVFLIGFLVLFGCAIIDMLSVHAVIVFPRILKYGLFAMVLMQSILLAKIFTGDFLKSEILTASLFETNNAYSRFIPTEFLKLLDKKSILDIHLGDHTQREMTILFSDIRSFTSLSEKMTPEENFKFLNSYLNRIAPIIKSNNGFIDKYIGDAIMGLFPDSPDDALLASIAMQREIEEYNVLRKRIGLIQLKVGIGLHTGTLILGTIGHDERMEGTVISDAVNLASRLEGLTKHYGSNILISEDTFNSLEDPAKYNYRLLDNVLVKGKADSIFVIEILDGFPKDLLEKFMETKRDFETGNLLYKQKAFDASIDFFKKVLEVNPMDTATEFYLKRAEYYNIHGAPPDWEGGEIFLDK